MSSRVFECPGLVASTAAKPSGPHLSIYSARDSAYLTRAQSRELAFAILDWLARSAPPDESTAAAYGAIAWGDRCEALADHAIAIGSGARATKPGEIVIAIDGIDVLRSPPARGPAMGLELRGEWVEAADDTHAKLAAALRVAVEASRPRPYGAGGACSDSMCVNAAVCDFLAAPPSDARLQLCDEHRRQLVHRCQRAGLDVAELGIREFGR